MSRFETFWRYFIFNLTENLNSFKIDLCDIINEGDILAIRTADKNFPYYIMKSTNVLYSCGNLM